MSPLKQALKEIDHWIYTSNTWHAKRIRGEEGPPELSVRPGLEREMINLFAEEYNFQFSEEVYELYQWHDGGFDVGEFSNPIAFTPLENAVEYIMRDNTPHRPHLTIFLGIGCVAYFMVPEATNGEQHSPIFLYEGSLTAKASQAHAQNRQFELSHYAPSITALMQAMAECAKTHDGISTEHMLMDRAPTEVLTRENRRYASILTPIYRKYGIIGSESGLWGRFTG